MRYSIYVESQFSAAHYLRMYKGRCENIHGHNWKVGVYVGSSKLDSIGMVMDFTDLKKILRKVLDKLDHKFLNKEVNFFKATQPTAENIARYIHRNIKILLRKYPHIENLRVIVWETPTQAAIYEE